MTNTIITRKKLTTNQRVKHTAKLFGVRFPFNIESAIFSIAGKLSSEYDGAYWEFYSLSNGGFYMAPRMGNLYAVSCINGYKDSMSADALGITACMYAYSHLSFSSDPGFAEVCANHYHRLRAYIFQHEEGSAIFSAID